MTPAFYLLSQRPDIEERLCAEVKSVLNGRVPAFADLPKLTYMGQVINEVLRLYPAAYLFAHEAVTDDSRDAASAIPFEPPVDPPPRTAA